MTKNEALALVTNVAQVYGKTIGVDVVERAKELRRAALGTERDAQAKLEIIRTWVEAERSRRDNYNRGLEGKGGQRVGDSHSPRLPISCLHELERMLR